MPPRRLTGQVASFAAAVCRSWCAAAPIGPICPSSPARLCHSRHGWICLPFLPAWPPGRVVDRCLGGTQAWAWSFWAGTIPMPARRSPLPLAFGNWRSGDGGTDQQRRGDPGGQWRAWRAWGTPAGHAGTCGTAAAITAFSRQTWSTAGTGTHGTGGLLGWQRDPSDSPNRCGFLPLLPRGHRCPHLTGARFCHPGLAPGRVAGPQGDHGGRHRCWDGA